MRTARKAKWKPGLTAKRVERMQKPGRYRDGDIRGLYLQIGPTGGKSWGLRYMRGGVEHWYGLGPVDTFTLKEARERARAARQLLHDGIDPIEHKRSEKAKLAAAKAKLLTFREAAQRYFDQHEGKWGNAKHRAQFLSTLKSYAFPTLGNMPVNEIGTPEVLRAIVQDGFAALEAAHDAAMEWRLFQCFRPAPPVPWLSAHP